MKTIKETYFLFLGQGFIEDYLPNVELPSPHLQFEHVVPAYFFEGYKEEFSSKEEDEFLKIAGEVEMNNIVNCSMDDLFEGSNEEPYRQLTDLLKLAKVENPEEVIAYEEIYFDNTKSNVELEFAE